ncbi:MAG: SHOCT domain-containing protein, partial [Erythrobacter sp.]|nr:SHOCT domain-containing protein [Erythrobacter sp.]
MRGGYWLRCAAGALALAGLGSPALAQGTATQQLLQRLYEKGILTEEEYAALMAETQAAPAAAPAPAAAAPAPAAPPEGSERFVKMTEKGIGLEVGPATIKFSGSVNAFYVNENPDTP